MSNWKYLQIWVKFTTFDPRSTYYANVNTTGKTNALFLFSFVVVFCVCDDVSLTVAPYSYKNALVNSKQDSVATGSSILSSTVLSTASAVHKRSQTSPNKLQKRFKGFLSCKNAFPVFVLPESVLPQFPNSARLKFDPNLEINPI